MNKSNSKAVIGTAKMRIRLQDVKGNAPSEKEPWGRFAATVIFDGEDVGTVRHDGNETNLQVEGESEMRIFIKRFPDMPPHHSNSLDLETVIRMIAFEKL